MLSLAAAGVFAMGSSALAMDSSMTVGVNTTDLATLSPLTTTDLTFINGTYVSPSSFVIGSPISIGTLDDLDLTQALTITSSNSITLNSNNSNATLGSAPADMLYIPSGANLTVNAPVVLAAGGGNFDVGGSATIGGVISGGFGFAKTGAGALILNGSTSNTYTGATAINAGTLNLDFSNLSGATNLIPATSVLSIGTASLNLLNNSANPATQTFASTSLLPGQAVITANTGTTVNLGAFTANKGASVVFNGPATIGAGGVAVPATGTITTTTAGQGPATAGTYGLLATGGQNNSYATVGLYDWASTDTTAPAAGTSPYTIIGGSQIPGFYQVAGNNGGNPAATTNVDIATQETAPALGGTGNVRLTGNTTWDTIRFNSSGAVYITLKTGNQLEVGGILVTPNMGVVNCGIDTIRPQGLATQIVQNNTLGVLSLGLNNDAAFYSNTAQGTASPNDAVIKSGAGTLFINPITGMHIAFNFQNSSGAIQNSTNNYYDGNAETGGSQLAFFANGGVTVINSGNALGNPSVANTGTTAGASGTVNLNGGTLMGASNTSGAVAVTMPLTTNLGANRFVWLYQNGGGLAAQTNVNMTVSGAIGSAAGAGPLVIGIPASSANGNTPGLVPGTGSTLSSGGMYNTANPAYYSTGTVTLNGPGNYFYGGVQITGGATLNINSMWQLGGADYDGGLTFNGGTLQYAATLPANTPGTLGAFEDVTVNSAATPLVQAVTLAGNGTIDTNGHAITFANPVGNGGAGTLTVTSSVAGGSLTLSGGVNSGAGGVTVAPTGLITTNLFLAGSSTYRGATAVNAGTLTLSSPSTTLGNTAITVANGANLVALPGAGGNVVIGSGNASLTLNAGSMLNLADGSIGTLTVNGNAGTPVLTLGGATLLLDVGTVNGVSAGASQLVATGGTLAVSGAADVISLTAIGSAPATLTGIPLISVPGAGGTLSASEFTLAHSIISFGGTQYNAVLGTANANDTLVLNLTQVVTSLDYYFTGNAGSTWTASSTFATDHTGATAVTSAPGSANNVFLTADSATGFASQTLGGSFTINSLSFTGTGTSAAGSPITLGAGTGGTLTITAGNPFKNAGGGTYNTGVGIVVQSGSEGGVITAPVILGGSQIWEIDNSPSFPLTVSGGVSGSGYSLTKAGTGTLVLGGSNTYTGGTTINAGILQLAASSPSALPMVGAITVQGTGTFDINGNSIAVDALKDGGVSTGTLTSTTGAPTLTLNTGLPTTFSGSLAGTLGLTYNGSSTQTFSGSNSYTGMTIVNSGTLIAASNTAFGNANSSTGGLAMNPSSGTATVQFISSTPAIASLSSGGSGASLIVLGNAAAGTSTTLSINTTGTNNTFSGTINDQTGNNINASGNLVITGTGSLTLAGSSNFTGTTTPTGTSTLIIGSASALQASTLNYTGGNVSFGSLTAVNLGGLSGNQNLALDNASAVSVALSIGGTNLSSIYTGLLGGDGQVYKNGAGTTTFGSNASGGAVYTGNTTIEQGTVVFGGVSNYSGGTIDVTANNGPAGVTFADSAIVNSPAFLRVSTDDGGAGYPSNSVVLVENNANVTFAGFSFGAAADSRVPTNCTFTIQNNAVMTVNGPFETDITEGSTASNNAINLNGGILGVQNIVPGGNATNQIPVIHFNGGVLEALASDGANGSAYFLPASSNVVNVDAGGAIINPNGFNITINAILHHGTVIAGGTTDGGLTVNGSSGSVLLANANTYTGPTKVLGGTLIIGSANITAGIQPLPAGTNVSIGSVASIPAILQIQPNSGTISTPQVNSLTFAGSVNHWIGTLDVTNNGLIVHTGGATIANLNNQLRQGFNGGAWNGTGGILSSTAASDTTYLTAVGVIINDTTANTTGVLSGTPLITATNEGVSTGDGDLIIKTTYYGDANLDGVVDGSDYSLIDNGFINHLSGWYNGDFNYDGVVDGSDYTLIDNAFNMQGASLAATVASPTALIGGSTAVPEPATMSLIGLGAIGLLGRRNRRRN